ncbi:lytic murein transglycosylase [Terrihabitans sp. B22-R8]|uniref:lytic murein transglycosylase n=1 Tax=Terrihabitans sp. B22-R8 TaxID=3425128 RepID=UPI00403CE846
MRLFGKWFVAFGLGCLAASPSLAAQCVPANGFQGWLSSFKGEAASQGIGRKGLAILDGVSYDAKVIAFDRKVRAAFKGSFEQFAAQRVTAGRVSKARAYLKSHKSLFDRIESQFGVPAPILLAIWGMETDFGAVTGKQPIINGLASLASDCRRPELFQRELIAALKIIDQNILSVAEMRGAGHGELGQTQFLPSSYLKYAVDFDGDGKKDLMRSQADVLASTANYLKGYGWQRGSGWQPGSANFSVLAGWNKSSNYQRAIALFADKVAAGR